MHPDISIEAGNVYFTGNPYTTTRERPQSILALFTAMAESDSVADEPTLTACTVNAPLLAHIARPQAYAAMRELLAVKNPAPMLELMHKRDVLKYAFGFPVTDFSPLISLKKVETLSEATSPWQSRLILLLLVAPMPPEEALKHLDTFWGLTTEDSTYLKDLLDFFPAADSAMPKEERHALVEKYNAEFLKSLFYLRWALEDDIDAAKKSYLKALVIGK
jgi:hypothetical protein